MIQPALEVPVQIGMMNNPGYPIESEIRFAAQSGFDYLDLTSEPPEAELTPANVRLIRTLMADHALGIVGHTAYYLPIDCPYARIRSAVREELAEQLNCFAELGASTMTIHFNHSYPHRFFRLERKLEYWQDALTPLAEQCGRHGMTLLLENTSNWPEQGKLLKKLIRNIPHLGFHYDAGHAFLMPHVLPPLMLLHQFKHDLLHVHFSDNMCGPDDLHLPLGAGRIVWKQLVRELKKIGYDRTITLEVFSPDRDYLLLSRKKLRALWDEGDGN